MLLKFIQIFALQLCYSYSQAIRFQVNYTALPSVTNNWNVKIQTLINFSTFYVSQIVQPKTPNNQPLSLSSCGGKSFDQKIYSSVDFVIFVSVTSDSQNKYIAYSDICDGGSSQPTSGTIMFNAFLMDQYFDATHGYDHQRLLDVTIRELIHLLGMNQNLFTRFVQPYTLTAEIVYTHLAAIPVIKTPIAVQKAQTHFNCSTLTQIPVVQVSFGSGVNLFSSFIYSDFASNYIGVEGVERDLSPITLGILEDSGWYNIDYSYATSPKWGKNQGCEFVTKSCQSSLAFPEFCQTAINTSQCTFDSHSIGKCVNVVEDADCLLRFPDQISFQYPAQKLTCRNQDNNYPWTASTYEIYSPTSGCFVSSFQSFSGDKGSRCYQYSCSQTQIIININGNNLQCTNSEVKTLNGLSGQLTCPTQDQIYQLCNGLAQYGTANYCSMKGLLTKAVCFCDAGVAGPQCDQQVVCDSTCLSCQTISALSCTQCITGYTLQDTNQSGVGWCKQNSLSSCTPNCTQCQTQSASQCIGCSSSTFLAEIGMRHVGYCQTPIANCARIQYNSSGSSCYLCSLGFRPYGSSCLLQISQCVTYNNQLCGTCQMGYHVSGNATLCVQDVLNCGTYSQDQLTCAICNSQYQLFNLQCYANLPFCSTQNQSTCVQCNGGYHFTSPSCMPDINQCSVYGAVINGTQSCTTCQVGYIVNGNKCVKQITNCLNYSSTASSLASTCMLCGTGSHLGNTQQSCYNDVANCSSYTTQGDKCAACLPNFDLTMYSSCFPSIQNCSSRNYMDNSLCATCVNAAYTLSVDQKSCTQPITNCSSALVSNNTIICARCAGGYHVSLNQTNCYADLSLCQLYNDTQCRQCANGTILQAGVCYAGIMGCQNQTANKCLTCNSSLVLMSNSTCVPPLLVISNCATYLDQSHCAQCNTSYALNALNNTCFIPVANCSINLYNTNNITTCAQCNTSYILNANSTLCMKSVANCSQYTPDYSACILCNTTYLLDMGRNVCQPPIGNCSYRNTTSPFACLQCNTGFQLTNNSQSCYYCPIEYCGTCSKPTLLGILCSNCQPAFQPNLQRNQCLASCQVSYGLNSCLSCPFNSTTATVKCQTCANGYYLSTAYCYACTTKFAHCQACDSQVCQACLPGYYYDLIERYCYPCSSKYGDCMICNSNECQQCHSGSLIKDNTCLKCKELVPACSTCATYQNDTLCIGCLEGYFYAPNEIIDCIDCHLKFQDCALCNSTNCTQCASGYYLREKCYKCDASCVQCDGPGNSKCVSCKPTQILKQGRCTSNLIKFVLTGSEPRQAEVFASQEIQKISNMTYTTMGSLDYKQFFCDSDSNCNMNGRCIVSQCKCITNIFGSRCQFTNASTPSLQVIQNKILTYLTQLSEITTYQDLESRLTIIQTLSDTSQVMTDGDAQISIALLSTFRNKLQNLTLTQQQVINGTSTLLNTLGSFSRYFQSQQMVSSSRLTQLDAVLSSALSILGQIGGVIELPYQRIVEYNFDLKDPRQLHNFTNMYAPKSRLLQAVCNNDIRITKPQIQLTEEVITLLKKAQTSASTPLQVQLAHFYYNPHVNMQAQQIDSAIFRAEFLVNGQVVPISNLSTNIQLLIPKIDQSFSDTSAPIKCLTWNQDKQVWDDGGIDNSLTINCRFYAVCYSNHLSDFGMQITSQKTTTSSNQGISSIISTSFNINSIDYNSGFYLSLLWIALFIFFWILFWCQYKRSESLKRYKDKTQNKSEKRKYKTEKRTFSKDQSKSPKNVSILKTSKNGSSPKTPNTSRAQQFELQAQVSAFPIPIDQYLGQPAMTDRNLVEKDLSTRNPSSQMTRNKSAQNMWLTHPMYSMWNGRTSLSIKIQKLSLMTLELQFFTAVTAGFLSITPFKFGYLTVYFLVPIPLSWFSNYFFGGMAVCFRRRNGRINCLYWVLFIVFELGLIFVSVYCMLGLPSYFDLYLIVGVAFQCVVDLILVDLFVTYFFQTLFEDNGSPVVGFFRFIRFRGYYIEEKRK